ncbi:sulfite exporter TauE/SafE family protein [Anaeromicrobium sediminis]|uniref:Probable membrane transporter protein n=1 Tax=Anaeromicrobium sediminis TaxID=1478221 RepID=A0A267MGQ4_9FIRM|nr:sulfite exporter TauE/SafE family protein [Anaeromicrobium sediminis]PAB58582.1 permease [Anaeromicrobium sediminis]
MLNMVLITLGLLTAYFAVIFVKDLLKAKAENTFEEGSFIGSGLVGFTTNFFDTLGIGSFAPTTALLRQFKLTKDRTLPGTLNVSCTIPVVIEAYIFIKGIEVEPVTLAAMLFAAVAGAVVGAGLVSHMDEKKIQTYMATALIAVAFIMIAGKVGLMPAGGEAIGLSGVKLIIAVVVNFILGALMTIGIGLYAPCMALVYALGMSPKVAFPIMMGSCAFLMPAASAKFVKEGAYDKKASLAIAVFGSVGVFIAAYIVKSLPLNILTWLVIIVIFYTSISMFKAAKENKEIA